MQYAWLECNKGFWCLFSEKLKEERRKWEDEDLALKELQEEGWRIAALYSIEHQQRFRAYGLNRSIH